MKKVMVVLGIVMILVGLTGCGKSEKDYVGKYVAESPGHPHIRRTVLEIRQDHTWESRTEYKSDLFPVTYSDRWEIIEGKIVLHMSSLIAPEEIKAELKGNKLIDQHGRNNVIFVKQD